LACPEKAENQRRPRPTDRPEPGAEWPELRILVRGFFPENPMISPRHLKMRRFCTAISQALPKIYRANAQKNDVET
jgi:hypothetical protein